MKLQLLKMIYFLLRVTAVSLAISVLCFALGIWIAFAYTRVGPLNWVEFLYAQIFSFNVIWGTTWIFYAFGHFIANQKIWLNKFKTLFILFGFTLISSFTDQYNQIYPPVKIMTGKFKLIKNQEFEKSRFFSSFRSTLLHFVDEKTGKKFKVSTRSAKAIQMALSTPSFSGTIMTTSRKVYLADFGSFKETIEDSYNPVNSALKSDEEDVPKDVSSEDSPDQ